MCSDANNVIIQNKICDLNGQFQFHWYSSVRHMVQLFVYTAHKKRASTPARDTVRAAPAENRDLAPFMLSSPEIIAVNIHKIINAYSKQN